MQIPNIRHTVLLTLLLSSFTVHAGPAGAEQAGGKQPNILWIITEDMSPHFGCYGETTIETPNVDRLAAGGVKFTGAVVTAPVCSTGRSALVTGMYQTSIGAHHHRSGRGEVKIHLPEYVTLVPAIFNEAGYRSLNLRFNHFMTSAAQAQQNPDVGIAKTDYNFEWDSSVYSDRHWSVGDRPFFCQIQLRGGKHRGHGDSDRWPKQVQQQLGSRTTTDQVQLPPYLPEHPVILEDWAQYLDTVRFTDWQVGQILDRLQQAGELENTYVFFLTDHGISHVRNKQYCYDGGVRVPMIVSGPSIEPGTVRKDPVEHIDLAATSLALAGMEVPAWMQARDVLANDYVPRRYAVSARDRCDETVDRIRSLRSERFKYIRNFYPQRPYLAPNRYKDNKPIIETMRRLYAAGRLDEAQAKIMTTTRPNEELYDLQEDPYELHNLAGNPAHAPRLKEMRRSLEDWIKWSGDRGQQPEPKAMYDSDMDVYVERGKNRHPAEQVRELTDNIQQMKRWAQQGK